jgi:two-component system LytT family sensor kinase
LSSALRLESLADMKSTDARYHAGDRNGHSVYIIHHSIEISDLLKENQVFCNRYYLTPQSSGKLQQMIFHLLKKLLFSAHFVVVIGLLVFVCLPLTWPVSLPGQFWIKQGFNYCLWISIFYFNLNYLVPKILYRAKISLFIVLVLIALVLTIILNNQIDNLLNLPLLMNKSMRLNRPHNSFGSTPIVDFNVIITLVMFGISIIIGVGQKIRKDQFLSQTLEKEKISSELSFLKTQINPHFFFNILHTIYSLTETNVKIAKESIYTLSQMMRYVLYETKNDLTTLQKEVTFIEGYIKLMKLRLDVKVQVIFDQPKQLKNTDIAPMLFLPFVENAFKHGISNIHPSYVYIGISQMGETLIIEIRNSIFTEKAENIEESNGIGLANTRRRLDLIYPDRYSLEVSDQNPESEFIVKLKLNPL